jgi:hypothetical protein
VAVQPDGPRAVPVAEHPPVHLGAQLAHLGALGLGRELLRLVVERLDLLRDGEVLLGDGAVGDLRVDHRHPQRAVPEQRRDRLQRHAAVDRLGGERVPQLVRGHVPDASIAGDLRDGILHALLADPPAALDEQPRLAQNRRASCDPFVEQLLELRVQRDVAVAAQLAKRHVQLTAAGGPR